MYMTCLATLWVQVLCVSARDFLLKNMTGQLQNCPVMLEIVCFSLSLPDLLCGCGTWGIGGRNGCRRQCAGCDLDHLVVDFQIASRIIGTQLDADLPAGRDVLLEDWQWKRVELPFRWLQDILCAAKRYPGF